MFFKRCVQLSILLPVLIIYFSSNCSKNNPVNNNNSLSAPILASPVNGAIGNTPSLTLTWRTVTNAEAYNFEVSTAATFASIFASQTGLTSLSASISNLTNSTTYYWKVNAANADSSTAWSNIWSFTTGTIPAINMISIPAGKFQMGPSNAVRDAEDSATDEPVHSVIIGAFTMSQTLITQAQYIAVMGINPSRRDSGGTWPVESVNWYDAVLFCNKLSKLAGLDTVYTYASIYQGSGYDTLTSVSINYAKNGYRLPTEAEYEYADRAGTTTDYYWDRNYPPTTTADTLAIDSNAVWAYNSPNGTQPVATKPPNAYGLYDMSGNLWEWCNDWLGGYSSSNQTNPTGPSVGSYRVQRGGHDYAYDLCAAWRSSDYPGFLGGSYINGFRVVCGAR